MDQLNKTSDSTVRVHGLSQGTRSNQRKEARALKEEMEEKRKKQNRSFHDELILTDKDHVETDSESDEDSAKSNEHDEANNTEENDRTDENNAVDDQGHIDYRA